MIIAGLGALLAFTPITRGQAPAPGGAPSGTSASTSYEVWAIDQGDLARGGTRLYVYDGQRVEAGQPVQPQVMDLAANAAGVGDGIGIRPHMLAFNLTFSHGVIANVVSGHVYVIRTKDRSIVASIDVGEQAHHAEISPDGNYILVANQNGKRLARIRADLAAERFTYSRSDDLNLATLEDARHPDNAPICPVIVGGKAYLTLRGGGLYVVDYRSTPMRVVREYPRTTVAPAGCGGVVIDDKVYINSGTATSSDLYVFDATTDALMRHVPLSWTGSDGHGLLPTNGGRFLWMGNRADHNIVVINTNRDAVVGIITGFGAAPDIMGLSPSGRRVYVALRGPNNLTGGHPAKGETPGVAVLEVTDEGRGGRRVAFLPIGDQTPGSPNDPHVVGIRPVR
ncbi:MAG: hypothetical protein A2Z07_01300 [Armatimonadetes bacterium RBG_16_67_12]|nr:MAG: hypothetical protein A2Z07_01300 [Armatimonadetes bacterium RBG_16_67_12]